MKVLFGYMADGVVDSVYWRDQASGNVIERVLRTDGSIVDNHLTNGLYWAVSFLSSSHSFFYSAVVDDIRTAFKYLGKSSDLVELLPEVQIDPDE